MAVTMKTAGGTLHVLLTGDIETPVQQILLQDRAPYLKAEVLKVPHHGECEAGPRLPRRGRAERSA